MLPKQCELIGTDVPSHLKTWANIKVAFRVSPSNEYGRPEQRNNNHNRNRNRNRDNEIAQFLELRYRSPANICYPEQLRKRKQKNSLARKKAKK